MRKVGLILVAIAVVGFLIASGERSRYDTTQGAVKAAVSPSERAKRDFWEKTRWLLAGAGIIGVVLTILPGKQE